MKNLLLMILFFTGSLFYSQCSVNAGGNTTICSTSTTLVGTQGTGASGNPTWTLVSKPAGAPDPVITDPNNLTTNVTGMTFPGNYVFQISQPCTTGPPATSQVTIAAPGAITGFTAGPDITNIPATTGIANLSATVPNGYTPSWTFYHIYSFEFNSTVVTTNATMSGENTSTPTLTLTNTGNHQVDPAYRAVLRITSNVNPSCWYEDDTIVRFIPNHNMLFSATPYNQCIAQGPITANTFFIDPTSASPKFSTSTANSAGNPLFGTTVTLAAVSQPAGGNIQYSRMANGRLYLSGITSVGTYVFDLTISNLTGSSTRRITYNFNGNTPNQVSFLDPTYSNQMQVYSAGGSGGAVYCSGWIGLNTPITYYFKIDPADPASTPTSASSIGIIPGGTAAPTILENGAGMMDRNVVVTPPAGGWRAGTYKFNMTVGPTGCSRSQDYFIHISDSARPSVNVNNIALCYSGSGQVSATIPLPAIYQEAATNLSYFQGFNGRYEFTLVSSPAGAATPLYEAASFRTLKSTSTVISNLNKEGEYIFKIRAFNGNGAGQFLEAEYTCSNASIEDTFSIFVTTQVNSNAGSDQVIVGTTATLNGNNPGVSTGTWTLVSKPVGAPDPVIVSPTSPNSSITGLITAGNYTFRWTIATGTCINADDVVLNVSDAAPGGVFSAAWYRADATTTVFSDAGTTLAADNATLQQWREFNGKPFTLAQATATLRPQFSSTTTLVNFNPTVTYNGAQKWMQYDPVADPQGYILDRTQGAMFSAGNTTDNGSLFGFGVSGATNAMDDPGLYSYTNKFLFYPVVTEFDPQSTYSINGPYIGGGTWQNGAGTSGNNAVNITLDGFHQTYNTNIANVNITPARGALMVGKADAGAQLVGQQNEMIVFDYKLSDQEVNRVESYLAIKYGKTLSKEQNRNYLSSTGAVVWDGTANNSYYNNVFGIARDNISVMYQKQSRSVNANQKLIIGAGNSLANTNAANTNTLTEGQFLLTGDNGLMQSLTTPLSYTAGSNGITNYRFASIWKVQNTNTVGTVTVAWPKGVKNLYLVQSSNEIFDGTDTFTPMTTEVTVNGVVYNTANVSLTNGQFFTFAGFDYAPGGVFSAAWYRADAATTLFSDAGTTAAADNATIQQWNEFNGKPFTLAQASTALRPQFSSTTTLVNFNPTVNYNGTEKWMQYDPVANPQGYIIDRTKGALFSAGNTTSDTSSLFGFGISGSSNDMDDPGLYSYTSNKFLFYPVLGDYDPQSTYTINGPYIGGGTWENAAGVAGNNAVNITLDGFHQTYNTNIANVNTAPARGALMVGKADAGAQLVGQQNEMIVFANKLTDEEVNRVESYLAIKYGKTLSKEQNRNYLSSTGTVVWDGTANNSYYNNVFGIARDDVSSMYQKQSQSVNANQKLIIGAGNSLANTNVANTNTLTEGQFLLTGDNGLKQSLNTPLSYTAGSNGITNYRFESIWKVQNTNSVSTVTVAWPKGVKNLYLVQSSDAIFDATDTFTPMPTEVTVNGVVYNTANVTLGNGQFFTFAGFGNAPGGVATSLSYWYRADKNATNTGATTDVTGWTDMWNGTTVAQLGTNPLPKFVLGTSTYFNFNPGINFTAGTQTLGNNTVRTLTSLDYDVFTFTKEDLASGGAFGRLFSVGRDNTTTGITNWDGFGIWPNNSNLERRVYGGGTQYFGVAPAFSTTIPSIMYFKNTNTNTSKGLNGDILQTPTNFAAVGNQFGGHIFGDTSFSSNGSDNPGFIGHIGETIVYGAGTLSNTERRRVDSYLAIKYGITLGQVATDHYLDTDGNVVWNGADNTAFNSNIFGVGRDDIEVFEQKVSKSVNAGTILTIATINDFILPNLDASRTGFTNNKTYFLLGDNANAATTPIDVSLGSKTYKRIPKIWLAQEKNTDTGNLFFEADLTAYNSGTFVTTAGNVVMLISDDAAFTTNVAVVNPTVNNSGKWVYSQNIASGKYITFAVDPCYGPDSDGDGVPDMCDLDVDNDGILNTDECGGSNIIQRGDFATLPATPGFMDPAQFATATGNNWIFATTGTGFDAQILWDNITGPVVFGNGIRFQRDGQTQSITQSLIGLRPTTANQILVSKIAANNGGPIGNASTLTVSYSGVEYARIVTTGGLGTGATITYSNGASSSLAAFAVGTVYNNWAINLPVGVPTSGDLKFGFVGGAASSDDFSIGNVIVNACQDTDGDGIPDFMDLDSDNDGCLDAIEGSANFVAADLATAGGTVTVGIGSTALNQNLCGNGLCVDANGIPTVAGTGQGAGSSQNPLISSCQVVCYKPGITAGTALDTKVGITALNRAGATDSDNWPMTRKGGWLALEAKTKGFVPNRVAFSAGNPVGIAPANFVEGMMVYDSTNKCMKMYTLKDGDTSMAWHCISTQTCPD